MAHFTTKKAVRVIPGRSKYGHRFGGRPLHRILGRTKHRMVLHCLYLFRTDDPSLPCVLRERRWLPLYYPLFNNACDFAYEVINDDEIVVHLVSDRVQRDFPYEDYPQQLPQHPVRLKPLSYEEQKTLVYAFTADDCISAKAISAADKRFLTRTGYPFTQVGGIQWMIQGIPEQRCPNPKCEYACYSNMHEVFAVVWNRPIPSFRVWGEHGDYVQLVFQVCPKCSTIYVCNRCD